MNLQELIADSKRQAAAKKKKKLKSTRQVSDYRATVAELRKLKLARCVPESVHLRVTSQQCNCGVVWVSQNNIPLVKRVSPHLTHYEPVEDLTKYKELPHFVEVTDVTIPYCEKCLGEATYVKLEASDAVKAKSVL